MLHQNQHHKLPTSVAAAASMLMIICLYGSLASPCVAQTATTQTTPTAVRTPPVEAKPLAKTSTDTTAEGDAQDEPSPNANKLLPNFDRVNARLFRGAQPRTGGYAELAERGVKTVIDLRDADERADDERRAVEAAGMRFVNIPLPGLSRPDKTEIESVLKIIEDPASGTVFIHCKRGADRTGTVIACYRIKHDNWTADDALREAKEHGFRSWFERGMKDFINDYYRDQKSEVGGR